MFDISFTELMLIGVVALVVIGPERLPRVARTIGHLIGRAQRYVGDVKSDIQREMDLEKLDDLKGQMEDAAKSVKSSMKEATDSLKDPFEEARSSLKEASESVDTLVKSARDEIQGKDTAPAVESHPDTPAKQASAPTSKPSGAVPAATDGTPSDTELADARLKQSRAARAPSDPPSTETSS